MGRADPCSSRKTLDECGIPRHRAGYRVSPVSGNKEIFAKSGLCTVHQLGSEKPS